MTGLQATIDSLQTLIESLQSRSRPAINTQLDYLIQKREEARALRAEADALSLNLSLSNTQESIDAEASQALPDDPPIIAL